MVGIACAQGTTTVGGSRWDVGVVIDTAALSRALPLGARDKGFGLGHSDLTVTGSLGRLFDLRLTGAVHTHDRKLEADLEEASLSTRTLPAGITMKLGRFAAQLGYLNEQHPHADDFVERPLPYRAFFGQHWFDDGLRINWTLPTTLYAQLGLEVFRGRGLVPHAQSSRRPGALVISTKTGGDIGSSQAWQAGLALIDNRRELLSEDDDGHSHHGEHTHDHSHNHAHGAAFTGRRGWVADVVWKWSPAGNSRNEQLRVSAEVMRFERLNRFARRGDHHQGGYLSVVYRFQPAWEAGVSTGWIDVRIPHDDHFHSGRLRETSLMLAYKPTHMQTVRLQATRVTGARGFGEVPRQMIAAQWILAFGAHPAHAF